MLRTPLLLMVVLINSLVLNGQADTTNHGDEDLRKQRRWIFYGKDRPTSEFDREEIINSTTMIEGSDTINRVDEDGRKQGHWIYYGKDRPEAGFPKEGKIEEGRYVDDRKQGFWYKYHIDGATVKLKGYYENNRPNGQFWKYYPEGALKEEGEWRKNKYRGTNIRYYLNGNIKTWDYYTEEGVQIGESYRNFENGCREFTHFYDTLGNYDMAIYYYRDSCNVIRDTVRKRTTPCFGPAKPITTYDPGKGNIRESSKCSFNRIVSRRTLKEYKELYSDSSICNLINEMGKCYNKDRELFFNGICKDGKVLQGKMYFYDKDGILLDVEIWKNGEYKGDGQL